MSINQEGVVISPEGMARIEQRHEGKAALLEQMRQEREAQYAQRHSHVGVEIGRGLGDLSLMAHTYRNLAGMANYCAMAERDDAGRVLASLATGIMRAAVEMHGKEAEATLTGIIASITPMGSNDQLDPADDEPEGVSYVAFGFDEAMSGATPEEVAETIRLMSAPEPEQSLEDDEPHEGASLEVSVSPEPEETPQAKAARQRREAKAKAKQAGSVTTEPESA